MTLKELEETYTEDIYSMKMIYLLSQIGYSEQLWQNLNTTASLINYLRNTSMHDFMWCYGFERTSKTPIQTLIIRALFVDSVTYLLNENLKNVIQNYGIATNMSELSTIHQYCEKLPIVLRSELKKKGFGIMKDELNINETWFSNFVDNILNAKDLMIEMGVRFILKDLWYLNKLKTEKYMTVLDKFATTIRVAKAEDLNMTSYDVMKTIHGGIVKNYQLFFMGNFTKVSPILTELFSLSINQIGVYLNISKEDITNGSTLSDWVKAVLIMDKNLDCYASLPLILVIGDKINSTAELMKYKLMDLYLELGDTTENFFLAKYEISDNDTINALRTFLVEQVFALMMVSQKSGIFLQVQFLASHMDPSSEILANYIWGVSYIRSKTKIKDLINLLNINKTDFEGLTVQNFYEKYFNIKDLNLLPTVFAKWKPMLAYTNMSEFFQSNYDVVHSANISTATLTQLDEMIMRRIPSLRGKRCLEAVVQGCFCKKDVLRNIANFTGKHLCQGLRPATLSKKRL